MNSPLARCALAAPNAGMPAGRTAASVEGDVPRGPGTRAWADEVRASSGSARGDVQNRRTTAAAVTRLRSVVPRTIRPALQGGFVALLMLASLVIARPLGRMGDPLVLLLVLPPLAVSLEATGWSELAGSRIRAIGEPVARVLCAYALWLAMSALLTLDVAAVAAASVGISVGERRPAERDAQLGAAIVGSNVGSLLFPFSNLTNLVLLAGAGISFRAYVGAAAMPQFATAVSAGAVLLWRSRRLIAKDRPTEFVAPRCDAGPRSLDGPARLSGAIVLAGAVVAVAAGFLGADIAAVLCVTAALVVAVAVSSRRAQVGRLASSVPRLGVAVVLAAVFLGRPMAALAGRLPALQSGPVTPVDLGMAALVGGGLAAAANNLPAAAFGAVWLHGAPPALVVAYLVGTNVLALVTPHGSLATMLCRSVAARAGHAIPHGPYLRVAWLFALPATLAALAALALVR